MEIFNRRNALIGFLALRALKRARRNATLGYLAAQGVEHTRAHRRGRRALRLFGYGVLGLVSAGIIAGLVYFWRQRSGEVTQAAGEVTGSAQEASEDVAEAAEPLADAASSLEPTPAT